MQWFLLQLTGETVGEVKAVADMHQRKAEMAKHSDAFIALPGEHELIILGCIRKSGNIKVLEPF